MNNAEEAALSVAEWIGSGVRRILLLLTAAAALGGCGYFMAGTWEDDPGNWQRAFHAPKPAGATVAHSRYSRMPHWTYECAYAFEIQTPGELTKVLIEYNKLKPMAAKSARASRERVFEVQPWFAPGPAEAYEVWSEGGGDDGEMRLFVDRKTKTIFLSDNQL